MTTAPFGWSDYGWHLLSLFLPQIFYWISGTSNALARSMGTKQGPFCHNRGYSQGNKQCVSHGNSNAACSRVTCYPRPGVQPSQQYRFPLLLPISDVPVTWTAEHAVETVCSSHMPLDLLPCLWAHLRSLLLEPLCPGVSAERQKCLGLSSCLLHSLPHRPSQC